MATRSRTPAHAMVDLEQATRALKSLGRWKVNQGGALPAAVRSRLGRLLPVLADDLSFANTHFARQVFVSKRDPCGMFLEMSVGIDGTVRSLESGSLMVDRDAVRSVRQAGPAARRRPCAGGRLPPKESQFPATIWPRLSQRQPDGAPLNHRGARAAQDAASIFFSHKNFEPPEFWRRTTYGHAVIRKPPDEAARCARSIREMGNL